MMRIGLGGPAFEAAIVNRAPWSNNTPGARPQLSLDQHPLFNSDIQVENLSFMMDSQIVDDKDSETTSC